MKARLTQGYVASLKPEGKDVFHWDTAIPGFGVKVSAAGRVTWCFQRKVQGGAERRITMGKFPEMNFAAAWDEAVKLAGQIRDGADPVAEKKKEEATGRTVADVLDFYLTKSIKETSKHNFRLTTDKHIRIPFGSWRVDDLTKGVLCKHIEDTMRHVPGKAGTCIAQLRAAWSYAHARGFIPSSVVNPASNIGHSLNFQLSAKTSYKMSLEDDALTALLKAIKTCYAAGYPSPIAVCAVELILNTGARKSEIMTLKESEIDLERRLITKADHKTRKNEDDPRYIHLSDSAVRVLAKAADARKLLGLDGEQRGVRLQNDAWVFPSPGRQQNKQPHLGTLNWVVSEIGKLAGIPTLKPHNLRSLYINLAIDGGVPIDVVAENVGHSDVQTTRQHYLANKQSSLSAGANVVGAKLAELSD